MHFDIDSWVSDLTEKLKNSFSDRLLFVGLQGSYRRGEAKETSDIDIVVILDRISISDLKIYKEIISTMPESEKACGFFAGKCEIKNWPKMEIFQFKNDTKPILGSLDNLVPEIEKQDIETYVKSSSASLYHMLVHSYLYDKTYDNLKLIIKSLFFLFLSTCYLKTGRYASSRKELLNLLEKEEKEMLEMNVDNLSAAEVDNFYDKLVKYLSKNFCS